MRSQAMRESPFNVRRWFFNILAYGEYASSESVRQPVQPS
jgi:hypothetical protein